LERHKNPWAKNHTERQMGSVLFSLSCSEESYFQTQETSGVGDPHPSQPPYSMFEKKECEAFSPECLLLCFIVTFSCPALFTF